MKKVSTAKIVRVLGDADYEDVRILEVVENEENPREMYEFWKDQLEGSLGEGELVTVETEYL